MLAAERMLARKLDGFLESRLEIRTPSVWQHMKSLDRVLFFASCLDGS
jgi:hypothetical protein